jgi:hypothetical protein
LIKSKAHYASSVVLKSSFKTTTAVKIKYNKSAVTLNMDKKSKTFALILTVIVALPCLTLLTAKPANAQTMPTPSVPQFTVEFVNDSYGVTINPYTGQSKINQTVDDFIEITIQNQHLDYPKYSSSYQIYFNVRVKPHFSQDNWTELYPIENLTSTSLGDIPLENLTSSFLASHYTFAEYVNFDSPNQTSSSDTNINFPVVPTTVYQEYAIQDYLYGAWNDFLYAIPYGSQLDFEVEAIVGHNSTFWGPCGNCAYPEVGRYAPAIAYDKSSSWSNIQTITIGQTSTSPTPTPTATATHTIPEFSTTAIIVVFVILSLFAVVALTARKQKQPNPKHKELHHR